MDSGKKEKLKINVLAAPATYMLSDKYGSEEAWGHHIMKSLAEFNVFFYACSYGSDLTTECSNISIIKLANGKRIQLSLLKRNFFILWYFVKSRKILTEEKIDIIHHILPFGIHQTFNLLPLLGYTKKKPFIVGPLQSPHNYISDEELGFSQGIFDKKNNFAVSVAKIIDVVLLLSTHKILDYLSSKTLQKADAIICINEDTKKLYSQIVDQNKIYIITPGIDLKNFYFVDRNNKKEFVEILAVGYLIKRKGFDLIIRGLAKIIEENRHKKVILRVIGDGPQKENLLQLTKQLGLDKNVIFEGFVPNTGIAKYYQNADIFVSMSYSESFGQTLLESMATGLPVIATKIGGFKDIVIYDETGFLIDHDTNELKKYLIKLINDSELRTIMGRNARKIVEEKYDWKIIAEKYYGIYNNLINTKSGV